MNNVAMDDNLIGGQTYTFSFELGNWFSLPSINTILNDLDQFAPSFIQNVQAQNAAGLSPFTNYLNVTFTYAGDGSDVASDVAAAMVAAFKQGSNDDYTFASASMGVQGLDAGSDATKIAEKAGGTVGAAVGSGVKAATSNVTFDIILAVAALGVLGYFLMEARAAKAAI